LCSDAARGTARNRDSCRLMSRFTRENQFKHGDVGDKS
jgi:hypothetical protein